MPTLSSGKVYYGFTMELWDPKTSAFGGENESVKMCKCISLLSLPSFSPWMKTGLGGLC